MCVRLSRLSHGNGAVLLMMLLFLVPLMLCLMMYINMSWSWMVKRGLRVVTDNAALAGASALPADPTAVINQLVSASTVWGSALTVQCIDVGTYSGGSFSQTSLENATAVAVRLRVALPFLINLSPWYSGSGTETWKAKAIAKANVVEGLFVNQAYLVE
jgi:Flp pilus assembly protein TadG